MPIFLLVIIYLSFISLGLPDASLGVAWPVMYQDLSVSIATAGVISFTVTAATILSSLLSGHVLGRFGAGRVNFFSTLLTGMAMVGFAISPSLPWILACAIPLGLGAGSVDAGLNSYVALHYKAHHMNWLHSFWGVGATLGPVIMAQVLAATGAWRIGYWSVAAIQLSLAGLLFLTLPLWNQVEKLRSAQSVTESKSAARALDSADTGEIASPAEGLAQAESYLAANALRVDSGDRPRLDLLKTPGFFLALLTFLMYCGAEITMGLWGSSYLVSIRKMTVENAGFSVSVYFAGIAVGRFLTGFLALKWQTRTLIRIGLAISLLGAALVMVPGSTTLILPGFILVGIGFAPVFPGMVHETPARFGARDSQLIIGYQMAAAYVGSTLFPPVVGWMAAVVSLKFMPMIVFVAILALMASTERINRSCR